MGKRQKFIVMFYAFSVFIVSFIYVPYTRSYQGTETFIGHHLRATIRNFFGIEWKFRFEDVSGVVFQISIDSQLIIAEVIALTAITVAVFLVLKRE